LARGGCGRGECPKPCKNGAGIVRAREMLGREYIRGGNVQAVCPDAVAKSLEVTRHDTLEKGVSP